MGACGRVWGHVAGEVAGCGGIWQGWGYVVGGQAYDMNGDMWQGKVHMVGCGAMWQGVGTCGRVWGRVWGHVAGAGACGMGSGLWHRLGHVAGLGHMVGCGGM